MNEDVRYFALANTATVSFEGSYDNFIHALSLVLCNQVNSLLFSPAFIIYDG